MVPQRPVGPRRRSLRGRDAVAGGGAGGASVLPLRRAGAIWRASRRRAGDALRLVPQAEGILKGVRLTDAERPRARLLFADVTGRLLASWGPEIAPGLPTQPFRRPSGAPALPNGGLLAHHRTPGYETWAGLGWHGVTCRHLWAEGDQRLAPPPARPRATASISSGTSWRKQIGAAPSCARPGAASAAAVARAIDRVRTGTGAAVIRTGLIALT